MRRICYLTLLLLILWAVPGCKDKCKGLSPQVEVTVTVGGPIAAKVQQFEVKASFDGKTWKTSLLSADYVGYAGGRGRFVLHFGERSILDGTKLWLRVQALDAQKTALGPPAQTTVGLQPDGCNFVTVSPGGTSDGGGVAPPTLVLSATARAADIEILGRQADDGLYQVVSCDFDGDTFDDIAVASPTARGWIKTSPGSYGRVQIILSKDQKIKETIDLNDSNRVGATIYGASPVDHLGASLACGDLDKDGAAELIIGAPNAAGGRGKVYIYRGGDPLPRDQVDLGGHGGPDSGIDDSLDVELTGGDEGDKLGTALAVVDLEGTGFKYLALGAPGYGGPPLPKAKDAGVKDSGPKDAGPRDGGVKDAGDGGAKDAARADLTPDQLVLRDWGLEQRKGAGAVFIVPWKTLGARSKIDLALPGDFLLMVGGKEGEALGSSLAAGRLNENTTDKGEDLLAGAPEYEDSGEDAYGAVRVLRGRNLQIDKGQQYPRLDCANKQGAHSLILLGTEPNTGFGRSVAAGDLDADGFADMVVGAPLQNRVYVFLGGGSVLPPLSADAGTMRVDSGKYKAIYQGVEYSAFGTTLAAVQRSSGKSASDLLVGAPLYESGRGGIYWFRRKQGFKHHETIQAESSADVRLRMLGPKGKTYQLGSAVAGGRFTTQDNIADILAGAPGASSVNGSKSGRVYGVLGQK